MTAERIPLCEEDQKRHSSTPAGPAFANLQGKTFTRSENVQTKPGNFDMTDEAKALVDHARGCEGRTYSCTCGYDDARDDRIETQAREIERLREALRKIETAAFYHTLPKPALDIIYGLARAALGESHD